MLIRNVSPYGALHVPAVRDLLVAAGVPDGEWPHGLALELPDGELAASLLEQVENFAPGVWRDEIETVGEAVNAVTGEVTAAGQSLPALPAGAYPDGAQPLYGSLDVAGKSVKALHAWIGEAAGDAGDTPTARTLFVVEHERGLPADERRKSVLELAEMAGTAP